VTTLTLVALLGAVLCGVLFLAALAGQADGMWGDTQSTGPTLKRFLGQSRKVFAVVGVACALVAAVSAVVGALI
jgi:hypothetical protein